MTAIQFEVKKADIVDEFMRWLHTHSKEDVTLTFIKNSSASFDENGIEYVSNEEQQEIEKALENKECYEISHSKTVTIDIEK
jgi:hypothetical protein